MMDLAASPPSHSGKTWNSLFPLFSYHLKKKQLPFLLLLSRKVHSELPISKDFIRYRANLWFQPPLCFPLSLGRERELKNYFISHSPHAAVSILGVLPALYLSELLYWQKENTNIFGEQKLQRKGANGLLAVLVCVCRDIWWENRRCLERVPVMLSCAIWD